MGGRGGRGKSISRKATRASKEARKGMPPVPVRKKRRTIESRLDGGTFEKRQGGESEGNRG